MQLQKKSFTNRFTRGKRGGAGGYIIFLFLAIGAIGAFYFLSTLGGTRKGISEYYKNTIDPIEAEKCLRDSESLENHFNSIHEVKKEKITSEDIDIYEKATRQYGKHLEFSGMDTRINPRFDKMRRKLHDLRADTLRAKTLLIEKNAEAFAQAENYKEAEKLFETAYTLEEQINSQFALSDKCDAGRAHALKYRMLAMRATPMKIAAKIAEDKGREALKNRHWAKAVKELQESLQINRTLWNDYREIIFTDNFDIAKISTMLATAQSATDFEAVEESINAAKAAEAKKNWQGAIYNWREAVKKQKVLVADFPLSEFASETYTKALYTACANAESRPSFIQLEELLAQLQTEIRAQKTQRIPILSRQASSLAMKINQSWRNNTLVPETLINNLAYIDVKSQDIAQIQKIFFESLFPIPNQPEKIGLMNKEVSQAFYTYVIGMNPSANNKNQLAPVESVSYNDAIVFCARLSALVGYEVRLPSKEEFISALGKPDKKNLAQEVWSLENSQGAIQQCGSKQANVNGFYDLLGNVEEWLLPIADLKKSEAITAGGNCQTPEISLLEDSLYKITMCTEKSRLRGFRVAIDFSKPVNLLNSKMSVQKK